MREIKFRIFEDGCMSNLDCLHLPHIAESIILIQYTGLKDKNGVEIYEGDIVSFNDIGNEIRVVEFEVGGFYCISEKNKYHRRWDINPSEDLKVIGNIYENKELLNA